MQNIIINLIVKYTSFIESDNLFKYRKNNYVVAPDYNT